jgi:ABC-2 type transport system ATP-binding protein
MTGEPETMIETNGLGREFAGKWAVRDLTLGVRRGELYGFLGQNGAGKTTTIRMLTGLLRPSAGTLRIAGLDFESGGRDLKRRIGLVPDTPPLYDYLTGRQYVALVASLWGVDRRHGAERSERLLRLLELDEAADELCKGYSHGMRKKVHLAAVLATAPAVLLLDEPTTGLDPLSTRRLKDLLLDEARRGTAILFSTHVLEVAEQICHRIGILVRGSLRAEGTVAELRAAEGAPTLEDAFLRLTERHGAADGGGKTKDAHGSAAG